MSQRFGASSLHQRDSRSALFEGYAPDHNAPKRGSSPGYGGYAPNGGHGVERHAYRSATPNRRGQYSDAVLNELESQNDSQVAGIMGKVRTLKEVSSIAAENYHQATDGEAEVAREAQGMTVAIGDEIRESSALAEKMNDAFDSTQLRLKGTMNRMLRMAQRSGVSWKIWLLFFAAVGMLFYYVWLF
ncbi:protein transport protein bet1 [Conoideocrella luteorostrata]|uniref:Protein transport protein bet1 n=1 Tax=Conoideocrella luteorostrata TaxID=1105319 RepID=A0AAJ0CGU2_9HYPO|nr:protein transport protein bet1 [Conoideocrella luteorostrata]